VKNPIKIVLKPIDYFLFFPKWYHFNFFYNTTVFGWLGLTRVNPLNLWPELPQIGSWMGHRNKGKNQGDQIPINKISNDEIKKFKDKKNNWENKYLIWKKKWEDKRNFELKGEIEKKIKLTNESKIKNKNQENEDQIFRKKNKIINLRMKLKTN